MIPRKRLRGPRLAVQLVVTWSCVSALGAGCSSDTKTVTVDCPLGGASSSAGHPSTPTAGNQSSAGGSGGVEVAQAGEAGIPGAEAGAAQGGTLGGSGSGGSAGTSGGASGGHAGAAGRGGSAGVGGHAGNSASGGHGGIGGSTGTGGNGGSAGGKAAICGDKAVSSAEFCDDGTNTDLSYGCYACTTLPADTAPQGAPQCDACLAKTPTKDCFACKDYRACYACLRQQPSHFTDGYCVNAADDNDLSDPARHQKLSDECFNPSDPDGSGQIGGPAGPATRGSVCQALVACVLRTGCARGSADSNTKRSLGTCYFGDVKNITQPPTGQCASEYRDAAAVPAGYDSVAEANYIGAHFTDAEPTPTSPWFILGVVYNLLNCAADGCESVCYPNGAGGSTSGGTGGHSGGG